MTNMRCVRCNDTGEYLGNGMCMTDCNLCSGDTVSQLARKTSLPKLDKRSKLYQDSIKDLLDADPDLTRGEAVILFEETYYNSAGK